MYEEPEVAPVHPTGPTPATETVDSAPGFEAPQRICYNFIRNILRTISYPYIPSEQEMV